MWVLIELSNRFPFLEVGKDVKDIGTQFGIICIEVDGNLIYMNRLKSQKENTSQEEKT